MKWWSRWLWRQSGVLSCHSTSTLLLLWLQNGKSTTAAWLYRVYRNTFRRGGWEEEVDCCSSHWRNTALWQYWVCVCKATWMYWRAIFPPQENGDCLFAVQLALLFSPHLFLSFFLILLFFWNLLILVLKDEIFFSFFLQRMQYNFFLFICGASKHLNISSIFPWIVLICQAPGKLVVFGWTQFSLRSKFSVAHWLNRVIISCPFDGFKA